MASSALQVVLASSNQTVTLKSDHWLASGGQADVYVHKKTAYKIYNEENRLRNTQLNLWPDLNFFQTIQHPHIAKPLDILLNPAGFKIGFTMPAISAEPLCKAFHSNWHQKNQLTPEKVLHICSQMHDILSLVHSKKALLIDGNELNWLITPDGTPWLIDTDSWQYPGHPATAIMPSINDPLAHIPSPNQFTTQSDWFAWAIITFQLWTGIHPYKGTHPQYKPTQFLQRIKDGISCLDPQVSVPPSVRSWTAIPPLLLQWYRDIFAHKHRNAPPPLTPNTLKSTLPPHSASSLPPPTPLSAIGALFASSPRAVPPLPSDAPAWKALPSGHLVSTSDSCTTLLVNNRTQAWSWPRPIQPSTLAALHKTPSLAQGQPPIALLALSTDGVLQAISTDPSVQVVLPPLEPKEFLFGSQEGRVFLADSYSANQVFELRPTLLGTQLHIQAVPWPLKMLGSLWGQGAVLSWLGSGSAGVPQLTTLRNENLSPASTWVPSMHHAPAKVLLSYKCLDIFALSPYLVFVSAIDRVSKAPRLLWLQLHQNTEYRIHQQWDLDTPQDLNALVMPNNSASAYLAVVSFQLNSQTHLLLASGTNSQFKQISAPALAPRIPQASLFYNQQLFCLDSAGQPHCIKLQRT